MQVVETGVPTDTVGRHLAGLRRRIADAGSWAAIGSKPMNDRCQATKKHHLVSRVILRQFCGPRTLLQAFDIRSGKVKPLGPGGVCWIPNLRPADPNAFEVQWRHVEDQMPQAFAALERGDSLDEPLCDLLRRCLAVHLARSLTAWYLHQRALAAYTKTIEATVLRKPQNAQHTRHESLSPPVPSWSAARRPAGRSRCTNQILRMHTRFEDLCARDNQIVNRR
jgi:hypothetical protein